MRSNWWDNLIWIVLFIFLIPSGLAVAAWGSLPGQKLYAVKLFTENIGLVLAFSDENKREMQVELTGKRLNEATQLLTDESSADGLEYFRKQVEEAKEAIARAPAGEARTALTQRYVETLQNASQQLEQQRQVMSQPDYVSYKPRAVSRARSSGGGSTTQQVVVVNQVIQVNQVTQVIQVIQQIDQTQNQINQIINQVQTNSPAEFVAPTASPTQEPQATPTNTPVPTPTVTPEQQHLFNAASALPDVTVTAIPTIENNDNGNSENRGNGNDNP